MVGSISLSLAHMHVELLPGIRTYGISTVTRVWTGASPPYTGAVSAGEDRPTAGRVCGERGEGEKGVWREGYRRGRGRGVYGERGECVEGGERQALCINWLLSTVFYSCVFQPWCTLSSRKTSMNGGLSSPLRRRVPFALLSWILLSTTSFCHTGEEGERGLCVKTL